MPSLIRPLLLTLALALPPMAAAGEPRGCAGSDHLASEARPAAASTRGTACAAAFRRLRAASDVAPSWGGVLADAAMEDAALRQCLGDSLAQAVIDERDQRWLAACRASPPATAGCDRLLRELRLFRIAD